MTDMISSGPLTTDGIEDPAAPTSPAASTETPAPPPQSRAMRLLKIAGWAAFGLSCLILFTILKLPDDRIKAYVQGTLASMLAPKGITFNAEKGYVSVGWGLSYVMKNVTLNFPPPQPAAKIEKIVATPSLLPLILGYQGGTLAVYSGDGKMTASFSMKGSQVSGTLDAKQLDLGKTGILALAGGPQGSGIVTGNGSFNGDTSIPSTLSGELALSLGKVTLEQQSIMGFNVPKVLLSEGKLELVADKGKATIKAFKVGKPGSADDLQATASGDLILGRNWESSTLNAKVNFKLSETVMKAFILIDALLGAGKQGDGSYTLTLTGPVTAPNPVPVPPGAPK